MPLLNNAVHRNSVTRPNANKVANGDIVHGNHRLFTISNHTGGLGTKIHQPANGFGGAASGPDFQQAAKKDEGDNHCGGVEVDADGLARAVHEPGSEHAGDAVSIGRQGPNCNEAVHVGCSVSQAAPEPSEKTPAAPELHGSGQEEEQKVNLLDRVRRAADVVQHAHAHDER